MPDYPWKAEIIDCKTSSPVAAEIVKLDTTMAKRHIDCCWWAGIGNRYDTDDGDWVWADIVQKRRYSGEYECVALRTTDDKIHGAMVLQLNAKSILRDSGAVLIERLAAAPANRSTLVPSPIHKKCGTQLLLFASYTSYNLGFGGAISCFSLPEAEQFYAGLGLVLTDKVNKDGWPLFELPAEKAAEWIAKEGLMQ